MVLNRNGIVTGYPKPIRKIAPRFDGVDAALSLSGNRIFLFRVSTFSSLDITFH